jgi:ribA/ribD-fused uncharacterized protein
VGATMCLPLALIQGFMATIAVFSLTAGDGAWVLPFYSSVAALSFSNFYTAYFHFRGHLWPSVEHAYQYFKLKFFGMRDLATRILFWQINDITPRDAKALGSRAGRTLPTGDPGRRLRWARIKFNLIYQIQREKFSQNIGLQQQLLSTGNFWLAEASRDREWGVGYTMEDFQQGRVPQPCESPWGDNECGRSLMQVRAHLRDTRAFVSECLSLPRMTPAEIRQYALRRRLAQRRRDRHYRARCRRRGAEPATAAAQ